jgi:hypothetical protein
VVLVPQADLDGPEPGAGRAPLPQATREQALANGKRLGADFGSAISSKMKALERHQLGSQLFFPRGVAGLFVNANATYVCCWLPPGASALVLAGRVPEAEPWRPFYGFMAVDYTTTATLASLVDQELGGWGGAYELFVARTLAAAQAAGYSAAAPAHRLLLWGDRCQAPGLVVRYLHLFETSSGLSEAQAAAAVEERRRLSAFDGTRRGQAEAGLAGVPLVRYV